MENLELRESLRRYVRTGEPPFAFTAQSLIIEARRRQRWRIGIGLGGGGAFTALAVASTMVLVPGAGGAGGEDLFDGKRCRWVLPVGSDPAETPQPTADPGTPTSYPGSPTSYPGSPTSYPGSPTSYPGSPTSYPGSPTSYPGSPTSYPGSPTSYPGSPTSYPGSPTSHPGSPTSYPGSPTAQPPTPLPTDVVPTPIWPSVPPDQLPDEVSGERQEAMSCFLKKQMLHMLPGVNHMAPSEPPMEVVSYPQLDAIGGWYRTYNARTMIIHNHQLRFIDVRVTRRGAETPPPDGERTTTPRGYEAYVARYPDHDGETLILDVSTRDSRIRISSEGGLLTLEQMFKLADSRELDLYRG